MKIRNLPTVLVLTGLILVGSSGFLVSAEEAGICEKAVFACLNDPQLLPLFGPIFCLQGYAFCKKFIEGE